MNSNCLEGMACPSCGSEGPFKLEVTCVATVHDDGTDEFSDIEWVSGGYAMCLNCEFEGSNDDFQKKELRMTATAEIPIPENLSPEGQTAAEVIAAYLTEYELTYFGGCRLFYSPEEWERRGEKYGLKSELIVCYDGGDAGEVLQFDGGALADGLVEALRKKNLYTEECTSWYSAVYKIGEMRGLGQ